MVQDLLFLNMSIIDRLKKKFTKSVESKNSQLEAERNKVDPIKEQNKILFNEIVGDFRFMQQLDELKTHIYHESKKLELERPYKCKYEEDEWVVDKRLLLRFYNDYKGQILIDSQDIRKYSLKSLRENFSLVSQETILFNQSIKTNIRYGNLNATPEEILNAAEEAGVNEFANSFSEKLDTIVGESGVKLSGGQRQRIAIARAMIKKAPILLFDEATSALDNLTEQKIQNSINKLMKNKTSVIIAHRLSSIEDSNLIYVLDKGKIIAEGTHQELLKNCNLYSKLHLQQELNLEF